MKLESFFAQHPVFTFEEMFSALSKNQLIPVMRKSTVKGDENWVLWTNTLLQGCINALNQLLPFHTNEILFLNQLYNHANLDATLLTSDQQMIQKIHSHPLLQWKIQLISKNSLKEK